eukprot:XP_022283593.1 basic proline-rich protein-like isoform X1 [Canis lupus familiaris]
MFLPEEDASWALAQLMTEDRHAMHGFFIPGFHKLPRFQAHHEHVLDRALPKLKKHMDEEQMCTGIYTPKWFLQCFIDWTPFSLTLKLWDAYILDGEQVLTLMAYTILKVHRTGPDEFPRRALGLEQVFPVPGPLLPSPAAEPPPRVEEPASPGPATQPKPPGPPPGQAILKAEEPLQEERSSEPTAAHLCPGTLGAPLLAQLPPAQDPSLARLPPQRWNSLLILPVQQDSTGRRPPDMGLKPEHGVPFPSVPARATQQTRPWSPPGTPITVSSQPTKDDAVGPRTPFLPRGHCSSSPSQGSDGHSQGRARAALSPLPRGPAQAGDPLPSVPTGQLDARRPRGQSVTVSAGSRRLWPAVTVPCLISRASHSQMWPPGP